MAVSKSTASLLAMTALDTTNLRLTVTVPAHGFVRVKMSCVVFGAATFPQILLGVLVGATVKGRVAPQVTLNGTALATTFAVTEADFSIGGLAAGSTVFDAAYAVQSVVASTNIKYGGPNDATGADAWGAFTFEIWDPQPLPTAAAGAANGLLINGTNAGPVTINSGVTFANSAGTAFTCSSSGSNGNGVAFTGNGSGHGVSATGGATGHGVKGLGGATSGDGANFAGGLLGHGMTLAGAGAAKDGLNSSGGTGAGRGATFLGASTGAGIRALSGTGATGNGIEASSQSTNGNGLSLTGTGNGAALLATAGATGIAASFVAGATSGDGIKVVTVAGHALNLAPAGTAMDAVHAVGSAASGANAGGHAFNLIGGAASATAGGTAGVALKATGGAGAAANNGAGEGATFAGGGTITVAGANGISTTGTGALSGCSFAGGATGAGAKYVGGGTSGVGIGITTTAGDGFSITPTAGHALVLTANGTSKHGMVSTGGTGGTSDGASFIAGTGGVDLRANITGNLTGNLSGSVGSVTGAVGSVTGAVGSVTGNVGGDVVGSVASVTGAVGSVTARVTANTDQLAGQTVTAPGGVTFPLTVASPTNITGGTITTVTNLSNAPTAGDFTAAMKTSLNAATPASVGSVTGNVGGNVVGSVNGNVVGNVQGNVVGTVASVVGNVGGSVVGNLLGTVNGNIVGNVLGNVVGSVGSVTGLNASLIDVATSTRLAPTVSGQTLDVSSGKAGIDWSNIGSPTTAVALTGTTISTAQVVASVTGAVGSVTGAVGSVTGAVGSVTGNVGGNVAGSVGSVVGLNPALVDVATSTRLAAASYTAPDNAGINFIATLTNTALDATMTSRAPASTALSNVQWTNARAAKLDDIGNVIQINGSVQGASNLGKSTNAMIQATVAAGATTTSLPTSAFSIPVGSVNQFEGRTVLFDAATTTPGLAGTSSVISASTNAAHPTLTVAALSDTPVAGDTFTVV